MTNRQIDILHVLDIAGIPSIISRYYNKLNKGKSDLIYHEKNSFSSSISRFYDGIPYGRFRKLLLSGFVKSFQYDIIHIHGAETLIPLFKITGKKIILHYHGSDINEKNRSLSKRRIMLRSMADMIIFNGKNMETNIVTCREIRKEYLANPVDTRLFSATNTKHGKVSFVSSNLNKEKTIEAIKKFGETTIIDLDVQQIPYAQMPTFLSKFEMYVDIKIMPSGKKLDDLSTTALQALSCGCKVYHNDTIIESLPQAHKPEYAIEKLYSYYDELL